MSSPKAMDVDTDTHLKAHTEKAILEEIEKQKSTIIHISQAPEGDRSPSAVPDRCLDDLQAPTT
jgi:hypothetical protein